MSNASMKGLGFRATCVAVLLCLAGCDNDSEAQAQADDEVSANAMVAERAKASDSAHVGAIDLQRIVDAIEAGEIESGEDLEAWLGGENAPSVDTNGDGEPDRLHVVERRTETTATFEIRATPANASKTEVEDAVLVATLRLEARADDGVVVVTAAYASAHAATVDIDVRETTVHRHVRGVSVEADGRVEVSTEAAVFVAWTFRPGRPIFVAHVFIHHPHHVHVGCWPPGHCKHGKWKAHGAPGHHKKHGPRHGRRSPGPGPGHKGHGKHGFKGHKGHKGKGKGKRH